MSYGENIRKILEHHYIWCKANGRSTSWYKKYKKEINKKSTKVY